ncbi:MAG: phenylalanine--tRNA ligase subunit alpha [Candidatus Komeilibacteria bacterium]
MEQRLQQIKKDFQDALKQVTDAKALEDVRNTFLGRKGLLNSVLSGLTEVAKEERPKIGQLANKVKREFQRALDQAEGSLKQVSQKLNDFDPTLPGRQKPVGHWHPLTMIQRQLEDTFRQMGFRVLDGPDIESEYYNFTALNIPADHPARDAQDTFWLTDGHLLRTQTSPVQIRGLQKYGAPLRAVVPGRVFRYEATDVSHDHTFYQMEGLMVDRGITIANLIAVMRALLQSIFQRDVQLRLRPGFFPFVEPGFEMDIHCLICEGQGCSVCKQSGWLELMPCGMVHPTVLQEGGVDPQHFTGFAFGLGLSRLVMMKYGIDDIRLLSSSDIRFLKQF